MQAEVAGSVPSVALLSRGTSPSFTGLNNPKIRSIADVEFDEYFGFTDAEVRNLLQYYELVDHYDIIMLMLSLAVMISICHAVVRLPE